jgi:hypothetical protein
MSFGRIIGGKLRRLRELRRRFRFNRFGLVKVRGVHLRTQRCVQIRERLVEEDELRLAYNHRDARSL